MKILINFTLKHIRLKT